MENIEEGCMCQYVPLNLREQIDDLAGKTDVYPSQVVTVALQIGLAVIIGKTPELLSETSRAKHGIVKQRKGKLSGTGV